MADDNPKASFRAELDQFMKIKMVKGYLLPVAGNMKLKLPTK
jgi:hypothetical protein